MLIAGFPAGPWGTTCYVVATGPGAAGATFECSLDGSAFQSCTSPLVHRDLADGQHEVKVRAVGAGGADATPATATWTVDRRGPRVRKTTPKRATRDRTPTIGAIITDRHSAVLAGDLKLVVDGKRVRDVRYVARPVAGTAHRAPRRQGRARQPDRHEVEVHRPALTARRASHPPGVRDAAGLYPIRVM